MKTVNKKTTFSPEEQLEKALKEIEKLKRWKQKRKQADDHSYSRAEVIQGIESEAKALQAEHIKKVEAIFKKNGEAKKEFEISRRTRVRIELDNEADEGLSYEDIHADELEKYEAKLKEQQTQK